MQIEIRPARETDAAEIAELNTVEMGYQTTAEQVREKLAVLLKSRDNRILVAVADGQVVGYIHANTYGTLYFPPLKNLMGIAVSAACRRKGIGTALLDAIEVWAKETGARGVRLNSGSTRLEAHEFYRSRGYGTEKQQLRLIKSFGGEA